MADYNKLLQVPRGTKARLEQIKLDLLVNTIVYATDTKELGIKLSDGNIEYFMNATDIDAIVDNLDLGDKNVQSDWNETSGDAFIKNKPTIPSISGLATETYVNNAVANKVDKNADITAGTHPKITYDAKGLVTGGGALAATDIPNLNASKINAGEFDAARIPSLDASKIISGTFDAARIPNLAPTKITQDASNRFVTDIEKASWDGKQDKLVAGDNITIVGNTISASGGGGLTFTSIKNWSGRINVGGSGAAVDLPLSENIEDGNKYIIVWSSDSGIEYMSMFVARASGNISLFYAYGDSNSVYSYGFQLSQNTSYTNRFKTSGYFYYELYSDSQEFDGGTASYTSFNIVDILKVN